MELWIDGISVTASPGQTLLELIKSLGLDCRKLSGRPLAAKIAGEVFNLNYVPVRTKDVQQDRASIRRAMAASNGEVTLIRYSDPQGRDVYARTAQFILFLALRRLWPKARAKMNCTVGKALYIEVRTDDFSADRLRKEVQMLISKNIPLIRRRVTVESAKEHFSADGQNDKARLLSWRSEAYFDEYAYDDFADYYYGELAPSTGYLQVWDIIPADGGFMFVFPKDDHPDQVAVYEEMPKFLSVSTEGERWCELMGCETVADLNDLVRNGKIRELIRVNEALHEKRFSQVADMVCHRGAKAVMLAGPSSSGKTTSANRLATQLKVHGKTPVFQSVLDFLLFFPLLQAIIK